MDAGYVDDCNNDHVLSPDGTRIAVSHHTKEDGHSRIYTFPLAGGAVVSDPSEEDEAALNATRAPLMEDPGGAKQHRDVAVVTAGVHDAVILRAADARAR